MKKAERKFLIEIDDHENFMKDLNAVGDQF